MSGHLRPHAIPTPRGAAKFPWYGPGFIWIVASVGSGSVLFTPRVGSRYEYALVWAALVVMLIVWLVIREVGRYTLVSGRSILSGFYSLPGPRGWAVWFIFLPQLCASAVIVAGIAALVGSALMIGHERIALSLIEMQGPATHVGAALLFDRSTMQAIYAIVLTLLSCLLVVSGQYKWIERVSTVLAAVLVLSAFITAAVVAPSPVQFARGLIPNIPPDFDLYFIIPWISFVIAGPAAVLWYSYWLIARNYGGTLAEPAMPKSDEAADSRRKTSEPQPELRMDDTSDQAQSVMERLRGWLTIMGTTAGIGVVGGGLVSLAFLILGAQLLGPRDVMPEGIDVARDLSLMLVEVWGEPGFWILISGIVIALWGSVMANQDGFGRLYADATMLLLPQRFLQRWMGRVHATSRKAVAALRRRRAVAPTDSSDAETPQPKPTAADVDIRFMLKNAFSIIVLTLAPIVIFALARDPVRILSIGGVLAAAHMPVLVFLTLWLNLRQLPKKMRPGPVTVALVALSGLFYGAVAIVFFSGLIAGN